MLRLKGSAERKENTHWPSLADLLDIFPWKLACKCEVANAACKIAIGWCPNSEIPTKKDSYGIFKKRIAMQCKIITFSALITLVYVIENNMKFNITPPAIVLKSLQRLDCRQEAGCLLLLLKWLTVTHLPSVPIMTQLDCNGRHDQ